jgi:hypothetical protein
MLAYKTQLNISNELLFLKIPSNFKGKRVEIIVLETHDLNDDDIADNTAEIETFYETFYAIKDDNSSNSFHKTPNEFQKLLLTSPTWTDNEYQNFVETRKLFNQ